MRAPLTAALALLWALPLRAEVSVLFSPGGNVDAAVLANLSRADRSVDVAMYSFSHKPLVAKLKELAGDGIRVRLILNKALKKERLARDLEGAGVDVRFVNPTMHHKFAIVDGPQSRGDDPAEAVLMTGSGNWTRASSAYFDEDFLVFEDEPEAVRSFQREFNLLWGNSRDVPGRKSHRGTIRVEGEGSPDIVFTSSNMEPNPSRGAGSFRKRVDPEDGAAGRMIIEAMDAAQESIKIATAHFRRKDFFDALKRALGRGVGVRMVLDQAEFDGEFPEDPADEGSVFFDERLAVLGATVTYKLYSFRWDYRTAKQMHTKYMIVDDAVVLTGSFNWSNNSETSSMENLIALSGPETGAYSENFQNVQAYGEGAFDKLLQEIKRRRGWGPCAFPPLTLTADQALRLQKAFRDNACLGRS